jgi:hypothetical protein
MRVVCPKCGHVFEVNSKKRKFSERKRDPIDKLRKILNYLRTQDSWVWIRRIAKQTKLKPYSVSYLIDKYLLPYVEILEPEDVYESTGIKMKMIRLKNNEINVKNIVEDINRRINS